MVFMIPPIIIAATTTAGCLYIHSTHKKHVEYQKQLFQENLGKCQQFITKLEEWQGKYLTSSGIDELVTIWHETKDFFKNIKISDKYPNYKIYQQFQSHQIDITDSFKSRNDKYVSEELILFKDLFDSIESKSLTEEQREIAVRVDNRNLIVASAGSGKTLTIIANILYLVKKGINPKDILVLSFNKKIAREIKERFENIDLNIDAVTFHKLGMDIYTKTSDSVFHVYDENSEKKFQESFLASLLKDSKLASDILKYFAYYLYPLPDLSDFENLGDLLRQTQHIKMETLKQHWEDKFTPPSGRIETIQGEIVKSLGELVIANYLFLNGIEYEYEKPYPSTEFSYKPDFYLPKYDIWIEHFGVLKNASNRLVGLTPSYITEMNHKIRLHEENESTLITTYFYEFINEDFWDILTQRLGEHQVKSQAPSIEKLQQNIDAIQNKAPFISFLKNLKTFLSLYKGNGYIEKDISDLHKNIEDDSDIPPYLYKRNTLFFAIFERYYKHYEAHLKSTSCIDFNDMLINAISMVEHTHPYKYVFVDEFQDTSFLRFQLINALLKQHNSTLTAIGDDWQSIYRFAGSNINIFTHFKNYVLECNRLDLSQTYRHSQELALISAQFIQKNPEQFVKRVNSKKSLKNPLIVAEYKEFADTFSKDSLYSRFILALENVLSNPTLDIKSVLILGRNNSDLKHSGLLGKKEQDVGFLLKKNLATSTQIIKLSHHAYPNIDFEYRTIHRSKGSEADLVFVINNKNHLSGFPNKMESDPIFKYLIEGSENYSYAEERRLFYVALTRTRTHTILMASNANPSEFIEEIKNLKNVKFLSLQDSININHKCPYCKTGRIILRQNKSTKEQYGDCEFQHCPGRSNLGNAVMIDDEFISCPKCKGIMIERTNSNSKEKFFGCSNYTNGSCKNTMQLKSDYKTLNQDSNNYIKESPAID